MLRRHVAHNIWVATLKFKVTTSPCSKLCPAHYFVILSQISKQFHRNDHHTGIESTCRVQHLDCYLEGQGHSMTFQHNCDCPITAVFEVLFKTIHLNDHHVETTCRAQHLCCYLEGQGHSMTFQQNSFRPITL